MSKSPLNEKIKFLFIGQGQVDTQHHLRGLPKASLPRNLEKKYNFARLCEVESSSTPFLSSWSISHDCANFCMVMRNQFSLLPFELQPKSPLVHFAHLCKFFACSCEIEKHGFSTSFCHLSHFFLLNPLTPPSIQLQSLVQVHCLFFIIHFNRMNKIDYKNETHCQSLSKEKITQKEILKLIWKMFLKIPQHKWSKMKHTSPSIGVIKISNSFPISNRKDIMQIKVSKTSIFNL